MKPGINFINVYHVNSFPGETIQISATSVTSTVNFVMASSAKNYDVIVTNAGPSIAYIAFGNQTPGTTAQVPGFGTGNGTANATPILSGAIYTFQKQTDNLVCNQVAAICPGSGTATVYFTAIQGS
jgi:UDP-N-acetylglucosamine enolpyruvyl transferase